MFENIRLKIKGVAAARHFAGPSDIAQLEQALSIGGVVTSLIAGGLLAPVIEALHRRLVNQLRPIGTEIRLGVFTAECELPNILEMLLAVERLRSRESDDTQDLVVSNLYDCRCAA